jgi:DNA-binding response OmpR family regulator
MRILVVEDDLCLLPALARILKSLDTGVEVAWASDLEEAFLKLREVEIGEADDFDLILSDISLPGRQSGTTLWDYVNRFRPDRRFAFMSGTPAHEYLKLFRGRARIPPFMGKPFRPGDCKAFVRGVLERPGERA